MVALETLCWLTVLCSVPQHSRDEGSPAWQLAPRLGSEEAVVRRVRVVHTRFLAHVAPFSSGDCASCWTAGRRNGGREEVRLCCVLALGCESSVT